jgi:hypothetical protein
MAETGTKLPILRPTPLTWAYVALAILALVMIVLGFVKAGAL